MENLVHVRLKEISGEKKNENEREQEKKKRKKQVDLNFICLL